MKSKPINKLLSFSELHYQRFLKIMELNGIKTYSNCLAFLIDSAYTDYSHGQARGVLATKFSL